MFLICKSVAIYSERLFNTLYIHQGDKTQMLKKISSGQNKCYKKCFLFSFVSPSSSCFFSYF